MKKIIILHGWNATPREAWFWLAKEHLEQKGYQVEAPELPGAYFPDYEGWVKTINDLHPDENTVLIGHSLGAVTIMRYLEKATNPVSQVILTAMPIEPMKFTPIASFFEEDFDWNKIKINAGKIDLIYEEEDQVVPLEHGKIAAEKLQASLMVVPGVKHLTSLDIKILDNFINEK